MKKALTLSVLMAAFLASGSLLSVDANAVDAIPGSKAMDVVKKAADAKEAAETTTLEQPKVDPDDIAAKAKEKASDKIEQVKQDMKDKAKENVNEKIEDLKDKTGLNQAKEASPADKVQEMKDMAPTGEKPNPAADLLKDVKKQ